MPVTKVDPRTQKLAGKRVPGPVMRTEDERISPRTANNNDPRREKISALDGCSTAEGAVLGDSASDERAIRGLNQRRTALVRANDVRFDRIAVRRRVTSGELHFDTFLDELPASCAKLAVGKVLRWIPKIGESKARDLVGLVNREMVDGPGITSDTKMKDLPPRARYVLSNLIQRRIDANSRRCTQVAA